MSNLVRNLTIVLAALSATAGVFIPSLPSLLDIQIPSASGFRWTLIAGMPVLLFVSFTWFNRQPAKDAQAVALQSIGQIAVFLAPFWWLMRHLPVS